MSPIAQPPPAAWVPPVAPVRVVKAYRPTAPYAAGGHRGIDLRARPGAEVRSPCAGHVVFNGAVGGGPPTLTIRCGTLRATLQRVQPSVRRGQSVRAGAVVGAATSRAVDLSARRTDDTYLDPAALLVGGRQPRIPPVLAPRRPGAPTPRAHHPAEVADRALVTPEGATPAQRRSAAAVPQVDRPLGLAGTALATAALVALALRAVRVRRRSAVRAGRALPARAQR